MTDSRFSRGRLALWAASLSLPPLLYWGSLTAWFQRDDFALLSFYGRVVHGYMSLTSALFSPIAQGTIRTLSERVYYLSFFGLFGMNALPYHIMAFLTFSAALVMVAEVCAKLTTSRAAGYWAAFLWGVNGALVMPLSWTAEYYQLLFALFLLVDVWLLVRFAETGERRYFIAQWVTFILGFGVLELNVVYPALATVYALCCAPKILRKVLPMFALSAGYMVLHFAVAPLVTTGPYKLYVDAHLLTTLGTYFGLALGSIWLTAMGVASARHWLYLAVPTAALTAFLVWRLRQRDWVVLLFPAWFLIVLSPLLPLREHLTYEYLTVPSIGLAMWAGAAIRSGFRGRVWWKAGTAMLLISYTWASLSISPLIIQPFHQRTMAARKLYESVVAEKDHFLPRTLLLKGVDPEMIYLTITAGALRLAGIYEVYVLNEERPKLGAGSPLEDEQAFLKDPALERQLVEQNRAVVYDVSQGARDVTAEFMGAHGPASTGAKPLGLASRLEMGSVSDDQLGPTWFAAEGGIRWMPKQATVRLRGPAGPGQKLYVTGHCPAAAVEAGPVAMQVRIDGVKLPPVSVREGNAPFSFAFNLPAGATGKDAVAIAIELSRTFRAPGDPRDLGLAVSSIEIR